MDNTEYTDCNENEISKHILSRLDINEQNENINDYKSKILYSPNEIISSKNHSTKNTLFQTSSLKNKNNYHNKNSFFLKAQNTKHQNYQNKNTNNLNNSSIFIQNGDINRIYEEFFHLKESNEYEYNLLLDNNFVDPSVIYGIYYSSLRLDMAFENKLKRFIIIGTEEGKIYEFMNIFLRRFDYLFSEEKFELKNLFLIVRFVKEIEYESEFNNQIQENCENTPQEKVKDNQEIKLFSCKILKNCGLNFEKLNSIAEGFEDISKHLKKLDENSNLMNKELEDYENLNESDIKIDLDNFDYFSNNEKKLKNLEESTYILDIPEEYIRLIEVEKESILSTEFLIFPVIKCENISNEPIILTRNNIKKPKNHQINHYKFLKQFLELDRNVIENYIKLKKEEIKNKINSKLSVKQEWHEDPYFRNNLEKKLHKKNILINLISTKNLFSENLNRLFGKFYNFRESSNSKIVIDELVFNHTIFNHVENISSNDIIKFYQSEFFKSVFAEEIENEEQKTDTEEYEQQNLLDSSILKSNMRNNFENLYIECKKIAKFFVEQKIKKDSVEDQSSNLYKKNLIEKQYSKSGNMGKLNKNLLFNPRENSKLNELLYKFLTNFIKKNLSKIFSVDKNQKIYLFSTHYNLISQELSDIHKNIQNHILSESINLNIEENHMINKNNEERINHIDPHLIINENSLNFSLFSENLNKQISNNEEETINPAEFHLHKDKFFLNENHEKNLQLFEKEINNSLYFQRLYIENQENSIYKSFNDFKKFRLDHMIEKADSFEKFSKDFSKSLIESINSYSSSEILHFYSNFQRYTTIINDLLSIYANTNYSLKISCKKDLEEVIELYTIIIEQKKTEFIIRIADFQQNFLSEIDEFFNQSLKSIEAFNDSIYFHTKSKLNEMEAKFCELLGELKIKIDNYQNEISEKNIILILSIIEELKEKGYLNEFIANYLINIQNLINLNNIDFDFYCDDIAKDLLIRLGVSSGVGIASGAIGFGISRILSIITADAVSGSVAGPVGTIAGTAIGIITMIGSSYSYFAGNKNMHISKYKEMLDKMNIFYELLIDKIDEFFNINKDEINSRLKKLVSYLEFTLRRNYQQNL